ncbi:sequence-specific DNA binding transcription factor [Actinidia rufa]|uniref:Sequence-specific DNA binding transcription factor n=1 Tax=Actinidia rufa TaxID=165716 RepID=A0A7J0DAF1_9ERIC|nr:sequence-specific DNA binding transcription factor [Actinidia rufa]
MEGNLSSGNMIPGGGSYGGIDLQGSMRVHHHQQPLSLHQQHQSLPRQGLMVHPSIHEKFPLTMSSMQDCDQGFSLADFPKGERGKNSASDEDEPSFTEDTVEGHNDVNGGKKGIPWQRVKWTDKMVRLLITAVSYIGEDVAAEHGNGTRRKNANLQKKGKWKSVSKVMAERGHCVSPQQCEDKFNDLNKRYKRLNEILGRGTSCQVVERPELLDIMDVSEKGKDEVRKILSSKHLFYEEMCSYHNGNRLHLPPDPELQRSLRLALRSRGDHENNDVRRHPQDDLDEDDQDAETDDRDEFEENHVLHGDHRAIYGVHGGSAKENETWMKHRSLQLEEQKLQIQAQMLELEKERFNWQRFCKKKDRELEMMRMENERMKLENERMALELKQKEMEADHN